MADHVAPEGQVWVCGACGKWSRTLHGDPDAVRVGWDVSCVLNAVLCRESHLTRDKYTRVTKVEDGGVVCHRRDLP
jgi:hypothetical protein